MTSEFELLHQFLEETEQLLLDQLDELEMEVRKGQKETDIRVSEEISILGDLINEMEEKCKQSASEFLQASVWIVEGKWSSRTQGFLRLIHGPSKA